MKLNALLAGFMPIVMYIFYIYTMGCHIPFLNNRAERVLRIKNQKMCPGASVFGRV